MINKWIIACVTIAIIAGCGQKETYDIVILNGNVYDGSGSPATLVDIGIRNERIAAIGDLKGANAKTIIDVKGLAVAPGFVDLHAHLESIAEFPFCENLIRQGITTALGGPDGGGPWPFADNLDALHKSKLGINVGFLVGHNVIRKNVIGLENRAPTAAELAQMKENVSAAMQAGAFGISTGLKYLPGTFSETGEVIE